MSASRPGVASLLCNRLDWREGSLAGADGGDVSLGGWGVSARAKIGHTGHSFGELVRFKGCREMGIFMPLGEVARVSGAKLVWPCSIGQDRKECRICILRGWGGGREPYKVKQGGKPENCSGNKLSLRWVVVEAALWHQVGGGEPVPAISI